jgi:hypothetical protein
MKTAIQEMIERLEKSGFFLISYDYDIFNEALEKEKEQIMMAYNDGYVNKAFDKQRNPLEYYNQTYNQ